MFVENIINSISFWFSSEILNLLKMNFSFAKKKKKAIGVCGCDHSLLLSPLIIFVQVSLSLSLSLALPIHPVHFQPIAWSFRNEWTWVGGILDLGFGDDNWRLVLFNFSFCFFFFFFFFFYGCMYNSLKSKSNIFAPQLIG